MKNFTISRIHTQHGIFRLLGEMSSPDTIHYKKVEFMGTDGWCEMDLQSPHTNNVLSMINQEIIDHILK